MIIDRFENEQAVLKDEKGRTIIWPKDFLPENLAEGDALDFRIAKDGAAGDERRADARDILNELLRSD